jgi:integrase
MNSIDLLPINSQVTNLLCQTDPPDARRMMRAELMGGHTHMAQDGVQVHVWKRGATYLARGSYERERFAETLGQDATSATSRLRKLLTEIEDGSFLRPSEARHRQLSNGKVPRLTLRQLVEEFLLEKRRTRGKQTAGDYRSRLCPVLDFAELPGNRQRWPLAMNIDRRFAVDLRSSILQHRTTRNGRPGGRPRPVSARQVINVMEAIRTVLSWAARADVRRLPIAWANPFTPEIVGTPPPKDPFRADPFPLDHRVGLVPHMDAWQLCQLALSLTLPLRPDEAAGLLVADVDFQNGWLEFGAHLGECNFTKEQLAFKLPFSPELEPLLRRCIGGRSDGPLLRTRRAFGQIAQEADLQADLKSRFDERLLDEQRGAVQTDHDRKLLFRRFLRELGGVTAEGLAREFKKVLAAAGTDGTAGSPTLYTMRSSVTTTMSRDAKLPHLELRYLTSHSTADILTTYTSLDIVGAMRLYFDKVRPLLTAIAHRAAQLGFV